MTHRSLRPTWSRGLLSLRECPGHGLRVAISYGTSQVGTATALAPWEGRVDGKVLLGHLASTLIVCLCLARDLICPLLAPWITYRLLRWPRRQHLQQGLTDALGDSPRVDGDPLGPSVFWTTQGPGMLGS